MKLYFNIRNRQSGKSSTLIYEYLKSSEDTFIITRDIRASHYYIEKIGLKNTLSIGQLDKLKRKEIKRLLIDEYLFFNEKQKEDLNKIINCYEEVFLFSSSNKIYNSVLLSLIKQCKEKGYNNKILKDYFGFKSSDIFEYWNNLLTHPDIKIINHRNLNNLNYLYKAKKICDKFSKEQFETEILGQYI